MAFGGNPRCNDVWAPQRLSLLTATITAFLSIITIPGNVLICLAVIRDPNKNLRTSFNVFVLNLAISDLITGLITEPLFVWFHASEADHMPVLGYLWLVHVSYFISCLASLQSIGALALDRYLTATSKYRRKFPVQKAMYISILIWVLSICLAMIYFLTTFYKYLVVFSTVATASTLSIIIFSYVRIYQSLHSHVEGNNKPSNSRAKGRFLKYERKATRAFLYILVVFTLFNIPSCTMVYVINFCVTCKCSVIHWLRDFQFLLALFNCASNQFLYALRMPTFLRAIARLLEFLPCIPHCMNVVGVYMVSGKSETNNSKDNESIGNANPEQQQTSQP